jgi:hypothetical protein
MYSLLSVGSDDQAFQFIRSAVLYELKDNMQYWQIIGDSTTEYYDPVLMEWLSWYNIRKRFFSAFQGPDGVIGFPKFKCLNYVRVRALVRISIRRRLNYFRTLYP